MPQSRFRRIVIPATVVVMGGLAAYGLLVGKPKPAPRVAQALPPPVVVVMRAKPQRLALSVRTQGSVRPRTEINVVSEVAGKITSVAPNFAVGGFLDADKLMVQVEDSDYQFSLVRAAARVADAKQLVAVEKGRVRQAAREWRDLGNAEANELFLRKPQLASAEAALLAALADRSEAQLDLQRTTIRAPFNGRISEKHVDVGQYITPGTVIARLYSTDVVEIRLPLTDRQIALLDLPLNYQDHSAPARQPAAVSISARFGGRQWQWHGSIVRTDASIDVDSRVMYAVAEVKKPFARDANSERPPLVVGLFVEAQISGRQIADVTVLPRSVLRSDGQVLVVDAADTLRSRTVRVLKSDLQQVWLQGLARDERVVVSPLAMAIAGMAVTVRESEQLAQGTF